MSICGLSLAACGDSGSATGGEAAAAATSTGTATGTATAQKTTPVTGQAAMGPLRGAFVNAFALKADGSFGANLGAVTTKTDGSFTLDVMVPPAGTAVAFSVQGGVYQDEATGQDVSIALSAGAEGSPAASSDGNTLQTWISDVSSTSTVAVTALTTMAAGYARQALSTSKADIHTAIGSGKSQVAGFFSANGQSLVDFDFTTTLPLDLTVATSTTADAGRASYGTLLSGLSQLAHNTTGAPAGGLNILGQLVAITRQDAAAFAQAAAQAAASTSATGALDANLLVDHSLAGLAKLGLQLLKGLPTAIGTFLDSGKVHAKLPPQSSSMAAPPPVAAMPVMVHGSAWSSQPMVGAQIQARLLDAHGGTDSAHVLSSVALNSNGYFGMVLPAQGWVRLFATNANISDPLLSGQAHVGDALSFTADVNLAASNANQLLAVAINPVTTMVSQRLSALLAGGQEDVHAAMGEAQADVRAALGFAANGPDLTSTQAITIASGVGVGQAANLQVALFCEGVASTLFLKGMGIAQLPIALSALALDMGDGKLNGHGQGGAPIGFAPGTVTYASFLSQLNLGMASALNTFPSLSSLHAQVGLTLQITAP